MTTHTPIRLRSRLTRVRGLLPLCVAVLAACATPGEAPPARFQNHGLQGFEITQDLRVPSSARSDLESALEHIENEEYDAAITLLEGVTESAPYSAAAHIDLGIAYRKAGRKEDAEASMARALELAPRHPGALNEMGIILRSQGRFAEARESYEAALRIYPDYHYARRNLAILCDLYMSDLTCAIEQYELYSKAVPEDESVVMWIADLRARVGR